MAQRSSRIEHIQRIAAGDAMKVTDASPVPIRSSESDTAMNVGQNAPAAIATQLRHEILGGVIPGGTHIRQDAVAVRFRVSQNTAREAFRLLEAESFLRSEPRRGVNVIPLTAKEAWEITELRALVEVQALDWAFSNLSRPVLDKAAGLLRQLDTATHVDDVIGLNASFHRLLYRPADRQRTLALIESLRLTFERYLRFTWQETGHLTRSQRQHHEILRLCRRDDRVRAAKLLREHILDTGRLLIQRLGK